MTSNADVPDDLMEAVKFIQKCKKKTYLTHEEKIDLNRAKLRIAYWSCRSENIIASKENLAYILGPADAAEIMGAYEKYLVSEEEAAKQKRKSGRKGGKDQDTGFWEGA